MDSASNKTVVDRTKILSEEEWFEIINSHPRSQDITEKERRKFAAALAYHFMTINDALELTEQQLMRTFHINSRGIIEQIFQWQETSLKNTIQKPDENSPSSVYANEPLVGLYETFSSNITEDDVIDALRQWRTINEEQKNEFYQSYKTFIDVLIEYGSKRYTNEKRERIWFRCRTCHKTVWIAKKMGAFTSFPACFRCQLNSWASIFDVKTEPKPILDIPLD